ncbi:hypothetical protein M8494_35945 [Serratia ureilytica]
MRCWRGSTTAPGAGDRAEPVAGAAGANHAGRAGAGGCAFQFHLPRNARQVMALARELLRGACGRATSWRWRCRVRCSCRWR